MTTLSDLLVFMQTKYPFTHASERVLEAAGFSGDDLEYMVNLHLLSCQITVCGAVYRIRHRTPELRHVTSFDLAVKKERERAFRDRQRAVKAAA